VKASGKIYRSRFVIAASGARESLAPLKNLPRFFGTSYFTCMICDGYRTTGRKLLVIDRTLNGARLSVGMKQMFTSDVTFLPTAFPGSVLHTCGRGIWSAEGRRSPGDLEGCGSTGVYPGKSS
jgi:hypothetical protein